jgi:archaellum biogenesis ATPase FlaH
MQVYQNTNYLAFINRWKKVFIPVFIISIIIATIFSGPTFIKPLYKSSATLYPVNLFSYSEESETEQMLQLMESDIIKTKIIDSLNLIKHYHIEETDPQAYEKTLKKLNNRLKIKRTQYESIIIDALDRNPEKAHDIVVSVIFFYNDFALQLSKQRADEILLIQEQLYKSKLAEVESLKNTMDTLIKQSGLAEYNILKESMRGSFEFIQTNTKAGENTADVLTEKSLDLFFYQTKLSYELSQLNTLKTNYENALSDANKHLEFANIVSAPTVPKKKAYPIRWIVVLTSVMGSLFICFAGLLYIEKIRLKKND